MHKTAQAASSSRSEQAYRRLRLSILSGEIAGGDRLKIETLQRLYDFSSSPIREALNRLAMEGLVDRDDNRGFSAAAVSMEDLRDLTQFRLVIECAALSDSVAHGDDAWEGDVVAAIHRLNRVDGRASQTAGPPPDEWTARHRAFHMALIGRCQSARLLNTCGRMFDQAERYRRLSVMRRRVRRNSMLEHRAIMEAALERDADTAVELLRAHIWNTSEHVIQVLGTPAEDAADEGARLRPAAAGDQ